MSFITPIKSLIKQRDSPKRLDETNFKEQTTKSRRDLTTLSPNSKASFESLPIPAPFSNYLTIDKKLSDNSFVAKCDILQRSLVFKRHMGIKAFQKSLDKWISLTANEHTVHAYDVIPLKDDSVLQVTEYREACRNVYRAIAKFNIDVEKEIPLNFIKFVSEFILQISIGLYECHQKGLHHCNLGLEYIIVQKQKESLANEHGFSHFFKLTYFCPWVEETFPFSSDDRHLIKLLLQKESQLTRSDVQDMVRIKDLYSFGLSIIDVLQGKTQRPKEPQVKELNADLNQIPIKWIQVDQAVHIMEILNLCLTIQLNPKPIDKLKEIIQIASKMYGISFFPKYLIPKRIDPHILKGPALKEYQKIELLKLTQNFTNRGVFLYLRGETRKALEFSDKAMQIYPQNYEASINSLLLKWNLSQFNDQDLLNEFNKLSGDVFDSKTPNILCCLLKLALGYPLEEEEKTFIEQFDKQQLPPQAKALIKIASKAKSFQLLKSLQPGSGQVLLPTNTFHETTDQVKSIIVSNNDDYYALIQTFEIRVYSARDPHADPRVFGLPKPQWAQDLAGDHHFHQEDDLMQDSLLEDHKPTEAAIEGENPLRQIVKFDDEYTGEMEIDKRDQRRGLSDHEIKNIMKKQRFMGCIDNSGQKIVFHVTNIKKSVDDEPAIYLYYADLDKELTSDPDLVYEQIEIPHQLAKDEVYSISFLDDSDDTIQIKSKALLLYTLRLSGLTAQVVSVTPAPLELRSIFSSPAHLDHFETLKSFLEDQTKLGLRVLLPAKDTRYVVTYSETTGEFSMYEVMLRRVTRRFRLRNPEYSREKEMEQEIRERERREEEDRKRKRREQRRDNSDDSDDSESSSEDSDESIESSQDDEELKEDQSSSSSQQRKKPKSKMKKLSAKKQQEEEDLQEKIKPFLSLQMNQLTAIEISPKANYLVIVFGTKVLAVRLTPHQELATLTLPIYMIKSLSSYNPAEVIPPPEKDNPREKVRQRVIKNPKLLQTNLRGLYESLVTDGKRFGPNAKEVEKEYIRSTDTLLMSYYIDQAFETPQYLGIEREDIQRIRNFQAMDIAVTVPYINRKSLDCLSKFHSFDQIEFSRKTDRILSCVFTSAPDSSIAFVAFDRQVHAYDFLEKKLLFKLSVANVKEMFLCDSERILAIRTHTEQLHVFSVTLQTLNWRRLMDEKIKGYKARKGIRKSSTQTINDIGNDLLEEPDDQTTTFNVNASKFDEEQIANCKILNFDENVKRLVFTRTYTENYFMAVITNTKFTIYEVYAEEESMNDQPLDVKDISSITVICQRKQDVPFSSVSSPQGLSRVTCLDFEDQGKRLVTGSVNGMVVLWDNSDQRVQWLKVLSKEDTSIDQVRCLTKRGPQCIAFTSKPEVIMYDLDNISRTTIQIPQGLGQCTKIHVERTESVLISEFFDKSIGVFNILTKEFVKRIQDVSFTRCFIDSTCTYLAGPDVRGRGLDFYWFKWENDIKKLPKPVEQKELKVNLKVTMPTKKEEQKKSSFCLIF